MKLAPLKPTDPCLRQICAPVSRPELRTKELQAQIDGLLDFVYGQNDKGSAKARPKRPITVGLSANQVGITKRISIVDLAIGHKTFNDLHVLVNPVIIRHGSARLVRNEGCVNLPEIWGPVSRFRSVTVQALDRSGNRLRLNLTGWAAILLQHEIDHLDGKLFIDHLSDPTKAHHVASEHFRAYNKKSAATWPHLIDVSELVNEKI